MAETGFLEARTVRPGAVATVILMHGAAIAALLLAKGPQWVGDQFGTTEVINVPLPPPPPPTPPVDRQRQQPRTEPTQITRTPVPTPFPTPFPLPPAPPGPPPDLGSLAGREDLPAVPDVPRADPPAPPPAPPVRVEPRLVSGDLQPPYPASEQRAEREGTVVIRLTIGPDGRVAATEKVRATSDAFYEATERHARARWRFRPATLDGRPVEGRKTLTVHFRLDET